MGKDIDIKEKTKGKKIEDATWLLESLVEIYGDKQETTKEEKRLGNALAQLISLNLKSKDKK